MLVLGTMMARGQGSTLRRKNTFKICGKPMIYWALKNAREAGFMDRIFVFTEDEEISEVTRSLGCDVIERSRDMLYYHGGFSKPTEWGRCFEEKISEAVGGKWDITVSLNCNIFLLRGETLRRMFVRMMEDELAELIFPVVEAEAHLYMENPLTGYLFPIWEDPGLDRQRYPRLFRRIGINICHNKRMEESAYQRRLYHVIPFDESFDVHTEEDVFLAETFLRRRLGLLNQDAQSAMI